MNYETLSDLFSAIASSIRVKTGGANLIKANDFPDAIESIQTGGGIDPSDATATAADILTGKTAYAGAGKVTGTLKFKQGTVTLVNSVTNANYVTISHNLGAAPSVILLWVENEPAFDSTATYNIVCGYALNFASGLIPGVRTSKSAAQCINDTGGGAGDTTGATGTTCVADVINSNTFRLRTNGASRCWAKGANVHWVVMAL